MESLVQWKMSSSFDEADVYHLSEGVNKAILDAVIKHHMMFINQLFITLLIKMPTFIL